MVNRGRREGFIQCGNNGSNWNKTGKLTVWVRGRGSETGGNTYKTRHMVMLTFKSHHPNYMEHVLLGTNTFPLSSSVQSLEVVIIITSCRNMLGQLRGENWEVLSKFTQSDSHPAASSEYNPFISPCPQFAPPKLVKRCQRCWNV